MNMNERMNESMKQGWMKIWKMYEYENMKVWKYENMKVWKYESMKNVRICMDMNIEVMEAMNLKGSYEIEMNVDDRMKWYYKIMI